MNCGVGELLLSPCHQAVHMLEQAIVITIDWEDVRGKLVAGTRVLFSISMTFGFISMYTMKWKAYFYNAYVTNLHEELQLLILMILPIINYKISQIASPYK